jgi:hypothetical protein
MLYQLFCFSLLMCLPDSRKNRRVGCGKLKTEKSTLAKMGNFDGNAEDVSQHRLQFARH